MTGFLPPLMLPRIDAALRDAEDGSPDAQWVAAVALAQEMGPRQPDAVEALRTLLSSPYEEIRAQAVEGLSEQQRRGAAVPDAPLRRALADPSPAVRCAAVDAAVTADTEAAAKLLPPLLDDPDTSVRIAAISAVEALDINATAPTLLRLLDDAVPLVRHHAATALASFGRDEGIETLLKSIGANDRDAEEASRALGRLGSERAIPHLTQIVSRRFTGACLKAAAAVALCRCSDGRLGIPDIAKLLSARRPDSRVITLSAIADAPTPILAAPVGELILDRDLLVASCAVATLTAIAKVDATVALAVLRRYREAAPPPLREEIAESINEISGFPHEAL